MMKWMIRSLCLYLFLFYIQSCSQQPKVQPYEANWESLSAYEEAPDWFKDAKFGIYLHWGVLCVPEFGHDWYPRMVHFEGSPEWNYHTKTFGPLNEFGYHHLVPLFKAEHFDPEAWAELFKQSGARFAGMVAEHHDGFSMWASDINPWNAGDMGPKRDLLGELEKAVRRLDMKFVSTFHMGRNLQIFQKSPGGKSNQSYFPYIEGLYTSSTDSLVRILYGNIPKDQFLKNWNGKLIEVIDHYSPDLIYFDGLCENVPDSCRAQFAAYYLNQACLKNKDVVITHKHGEFPVSVSLPDMEKGRMDSLTAFSWLTDETVSTGSWSYTQNMSYKKPSEIIHLLIDIVSKNGSMMLNISPRPDGVIPEEQIQILKVIGNWLNQYGEAIYETRPWHVFGEGPTQMGQGGHFVKQVQYTADDIRYTTKGDVLYALILGALDANQEIVLTALSDFDMEFKSVSLLNCAQTISWKKTQEGLSIVMPNEKGSAIANVIRIERES